MFFSRAHVMCDIRRVSARYTSIICAHSPDTKYTRTQHTHPTHIINRVCDTRTTHKASRRSRTRFYCSRIKHNTMLNTSHSVDNTLNGDHLRAAWVGLLALCGTGKTQAILCAPRRCDFHSCISLYTLLQIHTPGFAGCRCTNNAAARACARL